MKYLKLLALLVAGLPSLASAAPAMNVVFFLVDDLGYHDLSLTGSQVYETPRIDQLAGDGLALTQGYSAYPRCVPSRFGLMTGVHPSRTEGEGKSPGNMDPGYVTMAEALKEHGYTTYFAGKWHLGKNEKRYPQGQGFDINVAGGGAGAPGSYFVPYDNQKGLTGPEMLNGDHGKYLTDILTDKTVEFIEASKDKPFFVYLSHYAVHTPIEGKADKTERYTMKIAATEFEGDEYSVDDWQGRELRHHSNAGYAAMIESVDESLGRIVDTLKANDIYDRTIIVLTSDHGGLSNSGTDNQRELATSNLPLRAGKGHMYEGGIRVPVIVRWPGETQPASIADFPVTGTDYYPTILDMLDLPLRPDDHVDGVSFVPGIRGEQAFNANRSLFWYSDKGRLKSTGDRNAAVIRKGPYKLLQFFSDGVVELYDIEKDPGEHSNLARCLPDVRDALLAELLLWKTNMRVKDRKQVWGMEK